MTKASPKTTNTKDVKATYSPYSWIFENAKALCQVSTIWTHNQDNASCLKSGLSTELKKGKETGKEGLISGVNEHFKVL